MWFEHGHELSGSEPDTTNNRMELTAVLKALEYLDGSTDARITINTDSQYVQRGVTVYMKKWTLTGWKRYDGTDVLNQDLWKELDAYVQYFGKALVFNWVKGHSGIPSNEKADQLANSAANALLRQQRKEKQTPKKAPTVVHLKKNKEGKLIQGCDVYIGRELRIGVWSLDQSKWFNPFKLGDVGSASKACEEYEKYLRERPKLLAEIDELEGKVLGCWCKPNLCHGDVLVKLFNEKNKK